MYHSLEDVEKAVDILENVFQKYPEDVDFEGICKISLRRLYAILDDTTCYHHYHQFPYRLIV